MSSYVVMQRRTASAPVRRPATRGPKAHPDRFSAVVPARVVVARACRVAAPKAAPVEVAQLVGLVAIAALFAVAFGVVVWSFFGFSNEPIAAVAAVVGR